ncbi:PHP domain-containing protein [Thermococcus sp.]
MLEFPHDAHTHTAYSDGFGSVYDNIAVAERKGLRVLGITDHSHYLLDRGLNRYVREIRRWGSETELTVLAGVEANITREGIDVPHWAVKELDYVIASVHEWVETPGEYLTLVKRALEDEVSIIGHFGTSFSYVGFPTEEELGEILELAEAKGVAFEINSSYHVPDVAFLRECIKRGIKLTFASDAHSPGEVGRVGWSERVFRRAGGRREDLLFGEIL